MEPGDTFRSSNKIDNLLALDGRMDKLLRDSSKRFSETITGIAIWILFWGGAVYFELFAMPSLTSIAIFLMTPLFWWRFFEDGAQSNQDFLMKKIELELLREISDKLDQLTTAK